MNKFFTFALLGAVLLTARAVSAEAPSSPGATAPAIEVSYDGLETVRLPAEAHLTETQAPKPARRGGSTIFNATPDWINNDRVQVGGLAAADLNGDDRVDVVMGCYISNSFPPYDDWHNFIYYNTGSELEAVPSWTSDDEVSTGHVEVADFNGDTFPDVFSANGGTPMDPSVIYFGSASGPSTTAGWTATDSTWTNYAIAFDVDHDTFPEVVTANQGNSQNDPFRPLLYYENVGGTLATTPSWQSTETSIQNFLSFGDLDNDGWEDLAVAKWVNFESGVYRNVGGTLQTTPVWTTGDTGGDRGIGWADLDGDDYYELALGDSPTLLFDNVMGTLTPDWTATGTFFGQQDLRWYDVDMDGDQDLAEIHFSNGVVNLYLNQGGTLESTPSWSYDAAAVGTALAFGDINGDGLPDLITGYSGNPSLLVFYNQGNGLDIFADGFESGNINSWSGSS